MESITYKHFDFEPNGKVFNLNTKQYIREYLSDKNEVLISLENTRSRERLKYAMCRVFFDFDKNFQTLIEVDNIDKNKSNNSIYNLKIYLKNKPNKYVFMNEKDEVCLFKNPVNIVKFEHIRHAITSIILNE